MAMARTRHANVRGVGTPMRFAQGVSAADCAIIGVGPRSVARHESTPTSRDTRPAPG